MVPFVEDDSTIDWDAITCFKPETVAAESDEDIQLPACFSPQTLTVPLPSSADNDIMPIMTSHGGKRRKAVEKKRKMLVTPDKLDNDKKSPSTCTQAKECKVTLSCTNTEPQRAECCMVVDGAKKHCFTLYKRTWGDTFKDDAEQLVEEVDLSVI